jgi:hypothetical protein
MARRSSGLSCRLQSGHGPRRRGRHGPCIFGRRPASSPARHAICTFHCFRFRLPMAAGHGPCLTRSVSAASQVNESARMVAALQSPGSRRGVAPHRLCVALPPGIPPPSLAVAIAVEVVLRAAPTAIRTRSRPPRRGSLSAYGARLTTASRRQARPSGKRYYSFARSRQTSPRSDCRASGCSTDGSASYGRSAHPHKHEF